MDKTLFVFGCSYTEDYQTAKYIEDYEKYRIWKGGIYPDSWSKILADKLGYKLCNYGLASSGNQRIFRIFCEHIDEYKKGDMIILQWSYMHRYDWVNLTTNQFYTLGAGKVTEANFLLQSTHDDIILNRTTKPYYDEIISYMNLINCYSESKGIDLFFWSGDYDFIYGNEDILNKFKSKIILGDKLKRGQQPFNLVYNMGGQTIFQETNDEISDGHLAESGHKIMAELFYNHIKQNEK